MSEIVIVDPRLPNSNDPSLLNTLKGLKETQAQSNEDSKRDLKRENFTDQKQKPFFAIILLFILIFVLAIIVRALHIPKTIRYGISALFVFFLFNQVSKLG
jgi:hypothetical protein